MIIQDEFPLNGTFVTNDGEVFDICTMEVEQGFDELEKELSESDKGLNEIDSLMQEMENLGFSDEEDLIFYERMLLDEENYFN